MQRTTFSWLLIVVLLGLTGSLRAGVEPAVTKILPGETFIDFTIGGIQNLAYRNPAFFTNDVSGFNAATFSFPATHDVRKIDNLLQLRLDPNTEDFIDFPFTLTLDIKLLKYPNGGSFVQTSTHQLTINYDPEARSKWVEMANFHFAGNGEVYHEVQRVNLSSAGSPLTDNQKQLVSRMVRLQSDIVIERYFPFDVRDRLIGADIWESYDASSDELILNWVPLKGAELYDLEYVWVDAYDENGYLMAIGDQGVPKHYDLNRNSTRIQLSERTYRIPLVYEAGYLIYRVRGIGKKYDASLDEVFQIPGMWSNGYNNSPTGPEQCPDTDCDHLWVIGGPHEEDKKNWQRITAFAEDAKRKDVVSYFDGTYRNRQSVTGLSTDRMTLVGETFYDHQGRGAVQVLPVPVQNATLKFYENFNSTGGQPYDQSNFDLDNNCNRSIDDMAPSSGASRYYSSFNPDQLGAQAFLPDANGYPFTVTEWTPDNTGRVRRQSGVGVHHQLDSGHETAFFYGTPTQEEISRLFGTEVGEASHYKKSVQRDPNGQYSVSITDLKGNVIATALAGEPPANVDRLESYRPYPMEIDLLAYNTTDLDGQALVTNRAFTVTRKGPYDFQYAISQTAYRAALCDGAEICLDCVYDLEIILIDNNNCQDTLYYDKERIGPFLEGSDGQLLIADDCNNSTVSFSSPFSVDLDPGAYTITKRLSVNQQVVEAYVDHYIETFEEECPEVFEDILNRQLAQVDSTNCNIEDDEPAPTPCESARIGMLIDVSPGGQYGLIDFGTYVANAPLSVFNTSNALAPGNAHWQQPVTPYRDADGTQSKVNGLDPQQLSLSDFVLYWQDSWAESLLPYHPEYCYLSWCEGQGPSNRFDQELRLLQDYDEARNRGYFAPLAMDPYFQTGNSGYIYEPDMDDQVDNYNWNGSLSMLDVAILTALQKNGRSISGNPLQDAQQWLNANTPLATDPIAGDVWETFRALYLSKKEYFQYRDRTEYAMNVCEYSARDKGGYNECIGADPFDWTRNDFGRGLLGSSPFVRDDQPCSLNTFRLYKDKDKRFPSAYDLPGTYDPYGDPASTLRAGGAWASETGGTICGDCLCNGTIRDLINGVIQNGYYVRSSGFVKMSEPFAVAALPRIEFVAGSEVRDLQVAIVGGGEVLQITPLGSRSNRLCPMRIQGAGGNPVEWVGGVREIGCIYFDYQDPIQGTYYAKATLTLSDGQEQQVQLSIIKECDLWEACDPPGETCPPTEEATSLGGLFAQLIADQDLDRNLDVTDFLDETFVNNFIGTNNTGNIRWVGTFRGNTLTARLSSGSKRCNFTFTFPAGVRLRDLDALVSIRPDNSTLDPATGYTQSAVLEVRRRNSGDLTTIRVSNDCFPFSYCQRCTGGMTSEDALGRIPTGVGTVRVANRNRNSTGTPPPNCPDCNVDDFTRTYDSLGVTVDQTLGAEDCDPCAITVDSVITVPIPNACLETQLITAEANARFIYERYLDSLRTDFRTNYVRHCLRAAEEFSAAYEDDMHHLTLYYYNQANNLVKTIPPNGVRPLSMDQTNLAINFMRSGTGSPITPSHDMASEYVYNSLNQLRQQSIPDHDGESVFLFDQLGRIVCSQNPEQAAENRCAYTLYDGLGRAYEAGILTGVSTLPDGSGPDDTRTMSADDFRNWVNGFTKQEVTHSIYDEQVPGIASQHFGGNDDNYRGRIAAVEYREDGNTTTHATYYHYDIHGNVDALVQDLELLEPKKVTYNYDLISGNVRQVNYQPGALDQMLQRYAYDADNRLIRAESSRDGMIWDTEADYYFYQHGPLARVELGEHKVQGIDYAYTIQGWIKGVNSATITDHKPDIGQDSAPGHPHEKVARDAGGYVLRYFTKDYLPIGGQNWEPDYAGTNYHRPGRDLWNGNIQSMITAIAPLENGEMKMGPQGYAYTFDQLQRITSARTYRGLDVNANRWRQGGSTQEIDDYATDYAFDPNGNLLKLARNGSTQQGDPLRMDELSYNYLPGTNRLDHVRDGVPNGNYAEDIDDQRPGNYQYDRVGNLIRDIADGMDITWKDNGKVKRMTNTNGTLDISYDALGNRVMKKHTPLGGGQPVYTFYVLDGSGNVLSTYTTNDNPRDATKVHWESAYLYGAGRLAEERIDTSMGDLKAIKSESSNGWFSLRDRGSKYYEFTEHRRNVLATLSDRKLAQDDDANGQVDFYEADLWNVADYYPYGMQMVARNESATDQRYGFQGQEMDNELRGQGNSINYKYRMHDPRVGRFFAVDPLASQYPHYSAYQFSGNKVVNSIEYEGLEEAPSFSIPSTNQALVEVHKEFAKQTFKFFDESLSAISFEVKFYRKFVASTEKKYKILTLGTSVEVDQSIKYKISLAPLMDHLFPDEGNYSDGIVDPEPESILTVSESIDVKQKSYAEIQVNWKKKTISIYGKNTINITTKQAIQTLGASIKADYGMLGFKVFAEGEQVVDDEGVEQNVNVGVNASIKAEVKSETTGNATKKISVEYGVSAKAKINVSNSKK
jgi:RHS repeat-associated protein